MIRHLSFKGAGELIAELVRQAPSSAYCSNAIYADPSLPMDEKGWKGAELIFDIDADDIPTGCKQKHDWWYCQTCHQGGNGNRPNRCRFCHNNNSTVQVHWVCVECLDATKEHAYRLFDFLKADFGVPQSRISTHFSGSRGYHVHVTDDRFLTCDSQARAEIANYVRGRGLMLNNRTRQHQQRNTTPEGNSNTNSNGFGWAPRVELYAAGTKEVIITKRGSQKQAGQIEQIIQMNAALIDESVTTDIHRVFRMSGTLHGSSGMLKMKINSLEGFNPLSDPVVLGDERVKICIDYCPEFSLKDMRFGPYRSHTVEQLPIFAAVFLLAKGLARVSE